MEAGVVGVVRDSPGAAVGVAQGVLACDATAAVSTLLVGVTAVRELGDVVECVRDRRAVVFLETPLSGLRE